jgi:hypothetical protein
MEWIFVFFIKKGTGAGTHRFFIRRVVLWSKKWNLLLFGNKIPQKIDRNLPKKKVIAGHSPLF